jgi:hypothetical protein
MSHDTDARSDDRNDDSDTSTGSQGSSLVITAVGSLAAMGASMAAKSVLKLAYRKATGAEPPAVDDPRVTFGRALRWTLITAATAAVIELVVQRAVARAARASSTDDTQD